jgi:imidazole glycerol-phosphate synthase subunit HisH
MIGIIDYGSGNVRAIYNIYHALDIPCTVVRTAAEVRAADRLVLPGVGAFDQAVAELERSGIRQALDERVLGAKIPILGICVGMQLLAKASEEGERQGLGWLDARVRRFQRPEGAARLDLPHMGWNDVTPTEEHPLFAGIELDGGYYFLHSYYFDTARDEDVLARTTYGAPFACAVHSGNILGVQFHPEKSHDAGTGLLRNFARL